MAIIDSFAWTDKLANTPLSNLTFIPPSLESFALHSFTFVLYEFEMRNMTKG